MTHSGDVKSFFIRRKLSALFAGIYSEQHKSQLA